MRKSKLENYEDLLSALMDRYLSVDSLAFECNMDCVAVNKRLEFLIKNQLVGRHYINKKLFYALTTRGEAVYKTFSLTQRLNKLKKSIEIINESLQAIPSIAEQNKETKKRQLRDENY